MSYLDILSVWSPLPVFNIQVTEWSWELKVGQSLCYKCHPPQPVWKSHVNTALLLFKHDVLLCTLEHLFCTMWTLPVCPQSIRSKSSMTQWLGLSFPAPTLIDDFLPLDHLQMLLMTLPRVLLPSVQGAAAFLGLSNACRWQERSFPQGQVADFLLCWCAAHQKASCHIRSSSRWLHLPANIASVPASGIMHRQLPGNFHFQMISSSLFPQPPSPSPSFPLFLLENNNQISGWRQAKGCGLWMEKGKGADACYDREVVGGTGCCPP